MYVRSADLAEARAATLFLTTLAIVSEKLTLLDQPNSQTPSFRMQRQFFSVSRGRPFGLTRNDFILDEQPCKCAPEKNSSPAKALLAPVPGVSFCGSFCKRRLIGLAQPTLPLRQFGGAAIFHYNSSPLGMPPTAFHYASERTRFIASACLSASYYELPTTAQAPQNEHLRKNTRGEGVFCYVPRIPFSRWQIAGLPAFVRTGTAVCSLGILRDALLPQEVHS
jgi:hypothetical protein